MAGTSAAVTTALTPGSRWARSVRMAVMRAWAWGLSTILPWRTLPPGTTSAPEHRLPGDLFKNLDPGELLTNDFHDSFAASMTAWMMVP